MAIVMSKLGNTESRLMEFRAKSTDIKPIGTYKGEPIPNGSVYLEMDTQNVYFYDGETNEWIGD